MVLDWTFSFLSVSKTNPKPEIFRIASFRDGNLQLMATPKDIDIISQMEPLLSRLSYIAFFPEKDFVKIKLRMEQNHYAVHFLDKRFVDQNVLGVLSVTEFEVDSPFEYWGYEETMAEYIFEYFKDINQYSEKTEELKEFPTWIKIQVSDFYLDWLEAKKNRTAESFHQIATSEKILSQMEQTWDIQLINEYGAPILDMISFIDGEAFVYQDENEIMSQNLTSMSLTALKIVIDKQGGWNIDYLKGKLGNEMGFQYTFFKKFMIMNIRYFLIMNSSLYDYEKQECIQIFRGNEFELMDYIAGRIKLTAELFDLNGQLIDPKAHDRLKGIIVDAASEFFKK